MAAGAQGQYEQVWPPPAAPPPSAAPPAADKYEQVWPPPQQATPPAAPAKPGFFSTVAQDIGSMVKPLVGAGGVQLEDPAAFKAKLDAMTPQERAAQVAQTRSQIQALPHSDIASQESQNYQQRLGSGQSVPRALAETAYEAGAGANMTGFDEAARAGNTAEAIGHLAAPVVLGAGSYGASEALEHAPVAIQTARESLGNPIRTPEGELKPGVRTVAKIVGGAVGGALGSVVGAPSGGAIVGGMAGPGVVDLAFPESAERAADRASFTAAKNITEAQESALSENAKFDRAAEVKQARLEKAAQAAKDARDQAFIERGDALVKRQADQDKLDAAQTKAENALARSQRSAQERRGADMTAEIERNTDLARQATEAAEENRQRNVAAQQAEDERVQGLHDQFAKSLKELEDHRQKTINDRAKLLDQDAAARNRRGNQSGAPTADTSVVSLGTNGSAPPTASETVPIGSNSQDLISRTRRIRIAGEMPSTADLKNAGDMTQVPDDVLQVLAKHGDMIAKGEYETRRLKGSLGVIRKIRP